jgi:hypothetical protein
MFSLSLLDLAGGNHSQFAGTSISTGGIHGIKIDYKQALLAA